MADLEIFKGGCKPPRTAKLPTLRGFGGMLPQENFNAPKMDFEASGTYFGSIGTSLANDAATLGCGFARL